MASGCSSSPALWNRPGGLTAPRAACGRSCSRGQRGPGFGKQHRYRATGWASSGRRTPRPGLAYAPGSRRSLSCGSVEEEAGRLTARTNVGSLLDDRAEYVLARAFDAGSIAYLPLSSSSDVTCRCRRFRRSRCTRRSGVTIATACRCGRLLCRYWPAQGWDRNTPETCREGQCPAPWPGRVIR